MPLQSRGQETSLQVLVDGVLQQGSFLKVEDWEITPRTDLVDSDFVGEATSEPDIQHHGYDGSFTIREADAKALDLLDQIVAANEAGTPHPSITLIHTRSFRDPGVLPRVTTVSSAVMKMDSETAGGRKDYVKTKWSFKARRNKKQGP